MNKAALLAAKLRGLARAAGVDDLQPVVFPGGAAALAPGSSSGGAQSRSGGVAVPSSQIARPDTATSLWVLAPAELGRRVLGPALALASRQERAALHVILDDPAEASVVARRASYFAPEVRVWTVVGTTLMPTEGCSRALGAREQPSVDVVGAFTEVIESAGADAVFEHGVLRAEVRGLEIGRVVEVDGVAELAVGVGKHDREAHRMAHEVTDPATALRALVSQIRAGRQADAPAGLATDLSRERWLRWIACRRPDLVGARDLTPVGPPDERADLRAVSVAPALGTTIEGAPAVFAFSVGIDTNLVPAAADVDPDRALVLVVPEGDDDGITTTLVAALNSPARIETVPPNWPAMGD